MTFHIFDKQDLKLYGLDYKGITFGFHDEYNEMICWCKQNFGDPIDLSLYLDGSSLPARQRWYKRYANELWFRDEQDYLWFLLRWT
jgi:hypothetical protein